MNALTSLPPDGYLLESIANQPFRWGTVLGEWIDNAFDAAAASVEFDFSQKRLVINDDGLGCDDPYVMVQLGKHAKQTSTRLGRYGIGGKDAALLVGGVRSQLRIKTTHAGVTRAFVMDWPVYRQGWMVNPKDETATPGTPPGTRIEIAPVVRRVPSGNDWKALLDDLGYIYAPALKRGKQIRFRRSDRRGVEVLTKWELPQMKDIVNERITVGQHHARVWCGFVEGPNPRGGFTYTHEWRVIVAASEKGCGEYSPARVCGVVELDDTWPLTKNKDGIGGDADALYAEVARACEPTLKRAHEAGIAFDSAKLADAINAEIATRLGAMTRAKAKRGARVNPRSVTPTGLGSKHTRAAVIQPGETFVKATSPYRVSIVDLGDGPIGQVKSQFIQINYAHPYVRRIWDESNTDALIALVSFLLASEHCYAPEGVAPLLRGVKRDATPEAVSEAVGALLGDPVTIGGATVHPIQLAS